MEESHRSFKNCQQTGANYELIARHYLEQAGLIFEAANIRFRGGELDLIMRDKQQWVFVEVRYRSHTRFGCAADSITWHKQQKLLQTAAIWLAKRHASYDTLDCRFDVVAITGNQLEWLPNAFNADSHWGVDI